MIINYPHKFIVTGRLYTIILSRYDILIDKINIISNMWPGLIYVKITDDKIINRLQN
jgi:hypothetical protein